METQVLKQKEELVSETKRKATSVTIKEFTPAGVRLDYNLEGETVGRISGHSLGTVNALIKLDRGSEYEDRAVTTTMEKDIVFITVKGKGRAEDPISRSESEDSHMTSSAKLSWLNNTKTRSEVTYN